MSLNQDRGIQLLTESEAAKLLSISKTTLRIQRSTGELKNRIPLVPYIRLGSAIRYSINDIERYIEIHRVNAQGASDGH